MGPPKGKLEPWIGLMRKDSESRFLGGCDGSSKVRRERGETRTPAKNSSQWGIGQVIKKGEGDVDKKSLKSGRNKG